MRETLEFIEAARTATSVAELSELYRKLVGSWEYDKATMPSGFFGTDNVMEEYDEDSDTYFFQPGMDTEYVGLLDLNKRKGGQGRTEGGKEDRKDGRKEGK